MGIPKSVLIIVAAIGLSAGFFISRTYGFSVSNSIRASETIRTSSNVSSFSGLPIAGAKRYLIGKAARSYWLFLPPARSTKPAPVVFFMHGWMAIDPVFYGGWINHLLGKGYIVVYPTFQTSKSDTPESMRQNVL